MNFKMANRTLDELKTAKQELSAMIKEAVGEDKKGRLDPKGMKRLHDDRFEIAALVVQLVQDQVTLTDPTPFLVDQRALAFGDKQLFQELKAGVRVTKRAYGSKPLSNRLTKTEWGMTTTHREANVEMPLEEIAAGAMSAGDAVDAIAEAINRFNIGFVTDAIDTGVPSATADRSGVTNYNLRYTGLSTTNLQRAIDGFRDDGELPTIFARHIALFPTIRGFAGYSQDTIREYETRGVVGTYLGAPLVTMVDRYSRKFGGHVIRADRVWLAGQTKGAVMADVDVSFLNYSEVDIKAGVMTMGVRFENGILVWNPYAYRIIEV